MPPNFTIIKTELEQVLDLRFRFLAENRVQFIHNKCHDYGWADVYMVVVDGVKAGYGSVWGNFNRKDRDTLFEFYLDELYRDQAVKIFQALIRVSLVDWIECQTNHPQLSSLFYIFSKNIRVQSILFEDRRQPVGEIPGTVFRKSEVEPDNPADSGEYFMEKDDQVVATGGFLWNYNFPYADIYMDVKEDFRKKGYGSAIVRKLKNEIYRRGYVPAARCNPANRASIATLISAGFRICGALLIGEVDRDRM